MKYVYGVGDVLFDGENACVVHKTDYFVGRQHFLILDHLGNVVKWFPLDVIDDILTDDGYFFY